MCSDWLSVIALMTAPVIGPVAGGGGGGGGGGGVALRCFTTVCNLRRPFRVCLFLCCVCVRVFLRFLPFAFPLALFLFLFLFRSEFCFRLVVFVVCVDVSLRNLSDE